MITIKQMLGALLLASPFIAMTIMMVKREGWKLAVIVWGTFFTLITIIILGTYLLFG